jgi:hypothetical protein
MCQVRTTSSDLVIDISKTIDDSVDAVEASIY